MIIAWENVFQVNWHTHHWLTSSSYYYRSIVLVGNSLYALTCVLYVCACVFPFHVIQSYWPPRYLEFNNCAVVTRRGIILKLSFFLFDGPSQILLSTSSSLFLFPEFVVCVYACRISECVFACLRVIHSFFFQFVYSYQQTGPPKPLASESQGKSSDRHICSSLLHSFV